MSRKTVFAFVALLGVALGACGWARAVEVGDLPNPLARIKEGQWVSYRLLDGVEQKQTVASVSRVGDDTHFVVRYETTGIDIPEMTETYSVRELIETIAESLREADASVSRTRIAAGGRDYDVVVLEVRDGEDGVLRQYLSDLVPVTGLVRLDDDEEETPILEIIAFGE